jgi:DNA-binding response OmpR family regulator
VNAVGGGAVALTFLESAKPDLVVLDLMMPEVTGVDVLKFVRGQPRLAATPVVVLTNEPGNDLARHAARIGIQKVFRKDQCSPSVLMAAIDEILEPRVLAAARPTEPVADPAMSPDAPQAEAAATAWHDDMAQDSTEEGRPEARASFLADASAISADLGDLSAALSREPLTGPEQQDHLQGLFLKVRFLVEMANLTGLAALAQAAAVFDALLRVLMENPERLGPSTLRTVESLVEVVGLLFQQAAESGGDMPLSARVLVVDDDPVANEMAAAALGRAQLNASCTEDSVAAWQWINSEHFDLVLLKIEMPVLNGWQLRERLRRVPGYEKVPVIFVGAQDDLDTRALSARIGTDDLAAKSSLPQELAARVVVHLVRTQMQARFVLSGKDGIGDPQSTELADCQFQIN